MSSSDKIIDLAFGISQLSGNKTLFLRLMQKFADEYQQAEDKLRIMLNEGKWDDARVYIHTIKGVAGNLGFTMLFTACKQAEDELKQAKQTPSTFPSLCDALTATLGFIAQLQANPELMDNPDAPQSATAQPVAEPAPIETAGDAPTGFIRALKQSEFIAQEQLDAWLADTTADTNKQQAIRDAIDELDYDTALTLVRG